MSRSFHPPDTLSKEEIRTIADVRRDIWTQSFYGLGYGSIAGFTGHTFISALANRGYLSAKLNRNTALFSVLAGGALGSFLAATVTGKNQVHNLHPIFQVGAKPPPKDGEMSDYQKSLQRAQEMDHESPVRERARMSRSRPTSDLPQTPEDVREQRRQNRVLRRETLRNALQHQHGLSDSHGGHWVDEKEKPTRH